MALTLDQYRDVQAQVTAIKRMALKFSELGESKISNVLLQAAVRASRLKPTKDAAASTSEVPPKKSAGKGAQS